MKPGASLGRKRGLWRHIEYAWRAQAAKRFGARRAARRSHGAAQHWRAMCGLCHVLLPGRERWVEGGLRWRGGWRLLLALLRIALIARAELTAVRLRSQRHPARARAGAPCW
eukprot:scaffold21125_cov36-Phaeocystis_antarctica.AAC.1